MLRSKLVAEVCEALLASDSLERYAFSSPADAPSSSNVPFSSSDPKRKPEPLRVPQLNIGVREICLCVRGPCRIGRDLGSTLHLSVSIISLIGMQLALSISMIPLVGISSCILSPLSVPTFSLRKRPVPFAS